VPAGEWPRRIKVQFFPFCHNQCGILIAVKLQCTPSIRVLSSLYMKNALLTCCQLAEKQSLEEKNSQLLAFQLSFNKTTKPNDPQIKSSPVTNHNTVLSLSVITIHVMLVYSDYFLMKPASKREWLISIKRKTKLQTGQKRKIT